ncbi:septation ring formation regulator EzrA [Lactobacillus sp. Sy-1]|uniref:septation ring formation regulator EzrA n=1 Tax=Lactobacillus sp. Sy-1 TaxID=2109645 RepID=UPI001C59798B|nr:septation ring formation regulator EzrA [Lactobacillus sp. Sy-1]MBW1605813.1 septation ring formation regulator EzrA [Lactobacillus sp. Sy-1]
MGNSAVGILVTIVVLVLVFYLAIVAYQHYILKQMKVLQAKLEQIQAIPIQSELDEANKMNLSGETLEQLKGYQEGYKEILGEDFVEITNNLNNAIKISKTLNFLRTNQIYHSINKLLGDVTQRIQMIQAGLAQIKDLNKQHKSIIQDLTEKFKQMHSTLLTKNYVYGPTTDNLELRLTKTEEKFDQFKNLTESGDHEAAEKILPELMGQTDQMQALLDDIPKLYKNLIKEYPEQVEEIKNGHQEMLAAGYHFPEDNINGAIEFVNRQIEKNFDNLRRLEISQTRSGNHQIDKMIDQLYDAMELEITSKKRVQKQIDVISAFISHSQKQNIALMSELKQLDKNYDLDHQEIETTRELAEQIKTIDITHQNDLQSIADGLPIYSKISEHISDAKKALSQIEAQQREINASVSNLNEEEEAAVSAIQKFELQMHTMKRRIENLNLPGIPDDYGDAYSLVNSEIQRLSQAMNQTRISMDDINEQITVIKSDVDNLLERTNTMLDSAVLSEQMMQYANRYRNNHADILDASNRAHYLFDREYQYEESLNVIVDALNKIDPAIYERIQTAYYRRQK